jgi:hypothetical protein
MGYYIRILGVKDPDISVKDVAAALKKEKLKSNLSIGETEGPNNWSILSISNEQGDDLAQIERNPVVDGELGKEELDELRVAIADCKPEPAAKWLDRYFDKIKVIYAFQLLKSAFDDDNYSIISVVRNIIWNKTGGILQADDEGFSNEDGYHILWQFSDKVTGDWHCAVLNGANTWAHFRMDLGDIAQRREFWAGKIPSGATRL